MSEEKEFKQKIDFWRGYIAAMELAAAGRDPKPELEAATLIIEAVVRDWERWSAKQKEHNEQNIFSMPLGIANVVRFDWGAMTYDPRKR